MVLGQETEISHVIMSSFLGISVLDHIHPDDFPLIVEFLKVSATDPTLPPLDEKALALHNLILQFVEGYIEIFGDEAVPTSEVLFDAGELN